MSKLQPAKLILEDFPKQRDWIGPLFTVLNKFTGDLVLAFSNNLTVEENLYMEIREIRWVNSSGNFPLKFRSKFRTSPKGLHVVYLFNNTLGTYSTQTPWVVWTYNDGEISISDISGLTANSDYTIRLQVIYG